MRIWHAIDSLEVGGAETIVATLCREQQKAGHSPEAHCLHREGRIAADLRAIGIPVTVHGPDAAKDTGSPDVAVAETVKSPSSTPNVLFGSGPKSIVWLAFAIVKVRATSGAA